MYKHALTIALGLAALTGAGCTSTFTKGTPITEYQKGKTPPMQEAPTDGEYVLMSSMMNTTPKATLWLKQGDPLGFKTATTGKIIAVGGTKEIELPDGSYIWKRRPAAAGARATTQAS
jgi:hypothetical protein